MQFLSKSITIDFFGKNDKLIQKFIWKSKETSIAKTILKKKKSWGLTVPDFKTYYKATATRTA